MHLQRGMGALLCEARERLARGMCVLLMFLLSMILYSCTQSINIHY